MKLKLTFLSTLIGINLGIGQSSEAQVKLPTNSGIGCNALINTVKTELANKGYYVTFITNRGQKIIPQTMFNVVNIPQSFYNYPPSRLDTVTFSGLKDYPPDKLMESLSARIMANCSKVGLIQFVWSFEGWKEVGYFPNNTARLFTDSSSRQSRSNRYEWGYYFSP